MYVNVMPLYLQDDITTAVQKIKAVTCIRVSSPYLCYNSIDFYRILFLLWKLMELGKESLNKWDVFVSTQDFHKKVP